MEDGKRQFSIMLHLCGLYFEKDTSCLKYSDASSDKTKLNLFKIV